jgi:hypothetical protein
VRGVAGDENSARFNRRRSNDEIRIVPRVAAMPNIRPQVGRPLQTDPPWDTKDGAEGTNVRHPLDVSTNDAFPSWGAVYMVVITVVVGDSPIIARWDVRTPKAPC